MAPPLIGITCYGRDEEGRYSLPAAYCEAVQRAGGLQVLVPPLAGPALELIRRLDGLIMAGGGDLDPALYGGRAHEAIYNIDPARDASEIALAREAVRAGLPTLGICRGAQVINVALGGTLVEHLPDEFGEAVPHRLPPRVPTEHPVRVKDGSRLAAILGELEFVAASWHHQAIRREGGGLEVVAHAPDGAVEAAEMRSHPFLIAIQWHPELPSSGAPIQWRLFEALVEAAGRGLGS